MKNKIFPIVAIGSSAGGLQVLQEIIEKLPEEPDMAFVLISHMAFDKESNLEQILAKHSKLPICGIGRKIKVKINHIYVIVPSKEVVFSDGYLIPLERKKDKISNCIDRFFISLASDQIHPKIGIVLSGEGSDGAQGIISIKENEGITFALEPKSTVHSSMPLRAIETGSVDFVLDAQMIAKKVVNLDFSFGLEEENQFNLPEKEVDLLSILNFLKESEGDDFTNYKINTIYRRVKRRMMLHKVDTFTEYYEFLKGNHKEICSLRDDLLIKVTNFFRDSESFDYLQENVISKIIERKRKGPLRVWIPGCATGEEAYSFAICIFECLNKAVKACNFDIQIFATDRSEKAIEFARHGIYAEASLEGISEERIKQFFNRHDSRYQVEKSIREMCVFAVQDLVKDPPFSNLDIISCRNLLICFNSNLQKFIIPTLHYSLNEDGILFLGSSETISGFADLFHMRSKKHKIYSKKNNLTALSKSLIPLGVFSESKKFFETKTNYKQAIFDEKELNEKVDAYSLHHLSPSGFLLNGNLEIIQYRGNTSMYLSPSHGQASNNIFKQVREEFKSEIRRLLKVSKNKSGSNSEKIIKFFYNGMSRLVKLSLTNIKISSCDEVFSLISFREVLELDALKNSENFQSLKKDSKVDLAKEINEIKRLEYDLQEQRDHTQAVIEEYESANEELKSANEEILSSNEELQSTNEELETAKEELQSSNEELNTINDELRNRSDELARVNDDLVNLVNSTRIPVVMLSRDLTIRRFTSPAQELFNLIPSDVGRPIYDIRPSFELNDLKEIAFQVIESIQEIEKEVVDQNGTWYFLRFKPYLTSDHKITGVVISAVNIDGLKRNLDEQVSLTEKYEMQNKSLDVAKRAAEESNRLKTEFIANISHDIRTPLTVIIGFCERIIQDPQNVENKDYINLIKCNSNYLQNLIDDILDISKIESGKVTLEKKQTFLVDIISKNYLTLKKQAEEKNLNFDFHFETPIPIEVLLDEVKFDQIFLNIVNNAIKFTEEGRVDVYFSLVKSDKFKKILKIVVKDTGIGILKKEQAGLFQAFHQAKSSFAGREYVGTGLGLKIAKALAKAMGGDVILDNSFLGKGSSFVITVDLGSLNQVKFIEKFDKPKNEKKKKECLKLENDVLLGLRILLIEDSFEIQRLFRSIFQNWGVEIVSADNGKIGVEEAMGSSFDLIFMDIQMPILDGYEAIKILRGKGYSKPIIALTARIMKEEIFKIYHLGFNDLVEKPIDQKKILELCFKFSGK